MGVWVGGWGLRVRVILPKASVPYFSMTHMRRALVRGRVRVSLRVQGEGEGFGVGS